MNRARLLIKILSEDKVKPYLLAHYNDLDKALLHFKANIAISESFL
ncbi:hypothetical protein PBAC_10160 [Pedobacter glucosidilyticus]|nr:hypothetical protein PBAC_10160 [Pedobacter glucosidilyticus]